jgi:hypothetical protein
VAKREQELEWLLDLDPIANQVAYPKLNAEAVEYGVECQDGESRDLWPCPRDLPRKLCREPTLTVGVNFRVFNRTVNGRTRGKPKDVTFLFKGKYKHPKKKGGTRAKF